MFKSKWTIGRIVKYASAIIMGITLVILGFNAIRKNDEGYRQVRMNPLTGTLIVREKAGLYINGIYQVKTYQWETSYTFSNDTNDKNAIGKAIKVRFNDGGLADISGDFRFKLPTDEYSMIRIHETFGTPEALMKQRVPPGVAVHVCGGCLAVVNARLETRGDAAHRVHTSLSFL